MPPPVNRSRIGRRSRIATNMRGMRTSQSVEQRSQRIEAERVRSSQRRSRTTQSQERMATRNQANNRTGARRHEQIDANRNGRSRQAPALTIDYERLAFRYDPTVDYAAVISSKIGPLAIVCSHCKALRFRSEAPGLCCASGKVKLPRLRPPPEPLWTLVSGTGGESTQFLQNIQQYNNCFQMTSFGATNIIRGSFMPTFKVCPQSLSQHHKNINTLIQIQGQIYHRVGALLPPPDGDYQFMQMYFMGNTANEVDQRCAHNPSTRRPIVERLQTFLHRHNRLVALFKTALEQMPTDNHRIVIRADKAPAGEHSGRFNAPTINEVAIVIVGEQSNSRDIVLHRRNDQLKRVNETHRSYDALQYPLLFCARRGRLSFQSQNDRTIDR